MSTLNQEAFKKYFEANLLDGDDVNDCGKAMLDARDVYETLAPFIELERLKSGRDVLVWSTGGIAEFTEEGKEAIPAKIADLDTRIQAIERSE